VLKNIFFQELFFQNKGFTMSFFQKHGESLMIYGTVLLLILGGFAAYCCLYK